MGKTAFEQCAGFIRIFDGKNPLETTEVHPESYDIAEKLLALIGYKKEDLTNKETLKEIKTKSMVKAFADLKVTGKTLVILPEKNLNVQASAKNIPNVKTALVNTINTYDILKYDAFVVTKDAVAKIEEVYA